MNSQKSSLLKKFFERIFPPSPDFYGMLNRQIATVAEMAELTVEYMENGSVLTGKKIAEKEDEADIIKSDTLQTLNEAFSTPVDREDIYRAIIGIEDLANYLKATISEMQLFELHPNKYDLDIAMRLRDGIIFLKSGFAKLSTHPHAAVPFCDQARKQEHKIENIYRQAVLELFKGTDYSHIFKRREVYRHLSNAADRLSFCANNLQDIVVKIS